MATRSSSRPSRRLQIDARPKPGEGACRPARLAFVALTGWNVSRASRPPPPPTPTLQVNALHGRDAHRRYRRVREASRRSRQMDLPARGLHLSTSRFLRRTVSPGSSSKTAALSSNNTTPARPAEISSSLAARGSSMEKRNDRPRSHGGNRSRRLLRKAKRIHALELLIVCAVIGIIANTAIPPAKRRSIAPSGWRDHRRL